MCHLNSSLTLHSWLSINFFLKSCLCSVLTTLKDSHTIFQNCSENLFLFLYHCKELPSIPFSPLSFMILLPCFLGLTVVGIDPCPQDRQHNSIVGMHPKFTHLRMRLSGVKRNQLPSQVEWLLCDANISPHSALPHLTDLVRALSVEEQGFCGMFLTVKLGDTAEPIPVILQRVKDIGKGIFVSIGATHLPSNGQEILVVA